MVCVIRERISLRSIEFQMLLMHELAELEVLFVELSSIGSFGGEFVVVATCIVILMGGDAVADEAAVNDGIVASAGPVM